MLAGNGTQGYLDGTGTDAMFAQPGGVAVDAADVVWVTDYGNHCIRRVTLAGMHTPSLILLW